MQQRVDHQHPFTRLAFKDHGLGEWPAHDLLAQVSVPCGDLRCWAEPVRRRFAQFEYDEGFVVRWYVRGRGRGVIVDPRYRFGRPMIVDTGVPTRIFHDRFMAGETLAEIAEDFGVTVGQIEDAIAFEESRPGRAA